MIDFAESDDHRLVGELARGFAARQLRPAQRVHEAAGVSAAVYAAARDAGLCDLWTSLGPVARCAAIEELAFGDAGATLAILGPALAGAIAQQLGAPRADALHVHEGPAPDVMPCLVARGETVLQLAHAGGWRLACVRSEMIATLGLSAAGGARCVVVDTLAQGGHDCAAAIATARLAIAAACIGVARAALAYAAAYVQERKTFGARLADHQAVAFAIADMAIAAGAAGLLVQKAAHDGTPPAAAHAFVEAAGAALFVTERAVQLLGGHGYLKDHPVEKWMRDARVLAGLAGGRDLAAEDSEHDAWEQPWT